MNKIHLSFRKPTSGVFDAEKDILGDFSKMQIITVASNEWNTAFGEKHGFHSPLLSIASTIFEESSKVTPREKISRKCRCKISPEMGFRKRLEEMADMM